jgi:hypothetical protein
MSVVVSFDADKINPVKAIQTNASGLEIRPGSVGCVSLKLNPLDFWAQKKLGKALNNSFK